MPSSTERTIHDYTWTREMETRILDNGGGHLNHAVFLTLFENALNYFLDENGFSPIDSEYGRLVAKASTEYISVVHGWPEPVTVGIGCRRIGKSSVELEFGMFQHTDDARAVGTSVHIFVSREDGRPTPDAIPLQLRAKFESMIASQASDAKL